MAALVDQAVVSVDLGPEPTAYGDYFTRRWAAGRSFVNVEHDVVPWPGAIDQLVRCPEPWCHFDYTDHTDVDKMNEFRPAIFGCVKFGARIIAATLGVWTVRRQLGSEGFAWPDGGWLGRGEPEWRTLDSFFWLYAADRGWRPHLHHPAVENRHP
jgi:hypothetical protein